MPIPTNEDTPACAWCGELLETTDNQAEMSKPPVTDPFDPFTNGQIVHAEPCAGEANKKGWLFA